MVYTLTGKEIKGLLRSCIVRADDNAKNGVELGATLTEYFFKPNVYKNWTKGILRKMAEQARLDAGNKPLFRTEWNSMAVYSSPVHDEKHPGWSQQHPENWKAALFEGIPELLKDFDIPF